MELGLVNSGKYISLENPGNINFDSIIAKRAIMGLHVHVCLFDGDLIMKHRNVGVKNVG